MKYRFTLAFLALFLVSCASRNIGHDPESFSPYQSEVCFKLNEPFLYQEKRGIGVLWDQGIMQGVYKAMYQDDKGIYFLGPKNAVCQEQEKCTAFGKWPGGDGGIWVSKVSESDIRLFVINSNSKFRQVYGGSNPGALINALIKSEDGEFYIFDSNEEFVKSLQAARSSCGISK